MSMLIRLYPQAWRDRYEAEILDLLEQRTVSLSASVDLIRGAADAHLHPPFDHLSRPRSRRTRLVRRFPRWGR